MPSQSNVLKTNNRRNIYVASLNTCSSWNSILGNNLRLHTAQTRVHESNIYLISQWYFQKNLPLIFNSTHQVFMQVGQYKAWLSCIYERRIKFGRTSLVCDLWPSLLPSVGQSSQFLLVIDRHVVVINSHRFAGNTACARPTSGTFNSIDYTTTIARWPSTTTFRLNVTAAVDARWLHDRIAHWWVVDGLSARYM